MNGDCNYNDRMILPGVFDYEGTKTCYQSNPNINTCKRNGG